MTIFTGMLLGGVRLQWGPWKNRTLRRGGMKPRPARAPHRFFRGSGFRPFGRLRMRRWLVGVAAGCVAASGLLGGGCGSASIALKEKLGIPKRDQLVARVEDARDEQQKAKQQFASALDEFLAVTGT